MVRETVKNIEVVLWNVRSVHNVGSMFRTADAAGVSKIYIAGITPAPLDRFGRRRKDLEKVALGAEQVVSWEQCEADGALLSRLKEEKKTLVALEQASSSVDYKTVSLRNNSVLIVGNEVSGLPPEVLKRCDHICEIPMAGKKESLNVSVAFGIALFRFLGL